MKYAVIFFALLISSMAHSQAQQHRIDSLYDACRSINVGDVNEIECAHRITEAWDNELNKYYQLLMNILEPSTKKGLRIAQRQWLSYRDGEFEHIDNFYANMDGTMYRIIAVQRKMEVVRTRALELKWYYWMRTEEE